MALLLSIDTATETAAVVLGKDNDIVDMAFGYTQRDHAGFVQTAIVQMLERSGIKGQQLDGIAVSAGPGSYTGLRVGLSSAKGLCYGWQKPLILLNTLEVMARQAYLQENRADFLYCPMIDARRKEVFSALYDAGLRTLLPPGAYLLDAPEFSGPLEAQKKPILFFGSGMAKWKETARESGYHFAEMKGSNPQAINQLAQKAFSLEHFADVAYSEPFYFKSFYTTARPKPEN